MKNFIFLILILIFAENSFGQKTFDVQDFSEDYYGKVHLEQPTEVFSPGWIAIYQRKTGKELIKVTSEELVGDFEDGKIKVNVKQLPYGEQSAIIYEDFNFDGIKDFAIMDGQNSCYHGPSFQIYLATTDKSKFLFSKDFTRLSQDYCGMFNVDPKEKKIYTMTKSGCCWHEYSDFVVQNNKPVAVKVVEETYQSPFVLLNTTTWKGKEKIKSSSRMLPNAEDLNILMTFKLDNKKEVYLLKDGDKLTYTLIDEKGNIELSLPYDAKNQSTEFVLDSKDNPRLLSFVNGSFEYQIYEKSADEIGVKVKGKNLDKIFVGNHATQKGSLKSLLSQNLINLSFK